jgi:hypothetical protein
VGILAGPAGRSGADGTFRFKFKYSAQQDTSAIALLMAATRTLGMGCGDAQEFIARDGRELTGIRLVVAGLGTLRGRVVDADGRPVARVKVRATRAAANAHVMTTAVARDDGSFAFESLKAGEHILRVEGTEMFGPLEGVAVQVVADKETVLDKDIVVFAGATLVITLSAQGKEVSDQTFVLTFLDRFNLYAGSRGVKASADSNVKFAGLPPGELRFNIKGDGFQTTKTLTYQLAPGLEQKYGTLTLQPAGG